MEENEALRDVEVVEPGPYQQGVGEGGQLGSQLCTLLIPKELVSQS